MKRLTETAKRRREAARQATRARRRPKQQVKPAPKPKPRPAPAPAPVLALAPKPTRWACERCHAGTHVLKKYLDLAVCESCFDVCLRILSGAIAGIGGVA